MTSKHNDKVCLAARISQATGLKPEQVADVVRLALEELHRITIIDEKGPTAATMEACFSFGAEACFHLIGLYVSEHDYHGRNDEAGIWAEVALRVIPAAYREGCERIAPWFAEKTPARVSLDEADGENARRRSDGSVLQDQHSAAMIDQPSLFDSECRLAENRPPKAIDEKREFPTAMALVMARTAKRVAGKYGDLGLARAANELHGRAMEAIRNRQPVLGDEPLSGERRRPAEQMMALPKADAKASKAPTRLPTPFEMDMISSKTTADAVEEWLAQKSLSGAPSKPSHPTEQSRRTEGSVMCEDPESKRYAELHRKFLEENNPAVLEGLLDSYLSSVGEEASQMFSHLMHQYANSKAVQNLPHLERVQALQSRRHEAEEIVLHDVIFQPLPAED